MSILQVAGWAFACGFGGAAAQLLATGRADPNWMGLRSGERQAYYRLHGTAYAALAAAAVVNLEWAWTSLARPVLGAALAATGMALVMTARARFRRR